MVERLDRRSVLLLGAFLRNRRQRTSAVSVRLAARLLPIAGLMNLKYLLVAGSMPAIHPASWFPLASFLAISLLLRKAFCSWLCPVGNGIEIPVETRPTYSKEVFNLPLGPNWSALDQISDHSDSSPGLSSTCQPLISTPFSAALTD